MAHVLENIEEIAGRVLDSNLEEVEEGFPSITEIL